MRWLALVLLCCCFWGWTAAPPPVVTCHGVALGMTRSEVYGMLGQWELECNIWLTPEGDVEVDVCFDAEERVVAISGNQLEVGGEVVLRAGDSQERWQRVLGRPARSVHSPGPDEEAICAIGIVTSHFYPQWDLGVVQGWHPERGAARCFKLGAIAEPSAQN